MKTKEPLTRERAQKKHGNSGVFLIGIYWYLGDWIWFDFFVSWWLDFAFVKGCEGSSGAAEWPCVTNSLPLKLCQLVELVLYFWYFGGL